MSPIAFLRQTLIWLRYRNAAFVNSREELDDALRRAPSRIVVDGDETLRAYAASLALPRQKGPDQRQPIPDTTELLTLPPVGRITDGLRRHRRRKSRTPREGTLLPTLVLAGTVAALGAEILASLGWPAGDMRMLAHGKALAKLSPPTPAMWLERAASLLLALTAAACLIRAAWIVLGLSLPRRTEWRVEYRVPGRLVMLRSRRRSA